jgi:formyltetrahydrofolate deformylase
MENLTHRLCVNLSDKPGLLARFSSLIAENGGDISSAHHHVEGGRLYLRFIFTSKSNREELRRVFLNAAQGTTDSTSIRLTDPELPARVIVLCSREGHCLYDLLARHLAQDFRFTIPCVISNHETHRRVVESHGIPFYYVPSDDKVIAMREIRRLFKEHKGDWMVLARYMQVLDAETCDAFAGKIINIHHAFLPSFPGARPYHQAHAKGVKLVGATCHFVTANLDDGPIIEQDIIRVDHGDSPESMIQRGRDIEVSVLARGLRGVVEERVFAAGKRTVVFR